MTSLWWFLAQLVLILGLVAWAMTERGGRLSERQARERAEDVAESLSDALVDLGARGVVLERQVQSVRLIDVMVQAAAQGSAPQRKEVN